MGINKPPRPLQCQWVCGDPVALIETTRSASHKFPSSHKPPSLPSSVDTETVWAFMASASKASVSQLKELKEKNFKQLDPNSKWVRRMWRTPGQCSDHFSHIVLTTCAADIWNIQQLPFSGHIQSFPDWSGRKHHQVRTLETQHFVVAGACVRASPLLLV